MLKWHVYRSIKSLVELFIWCRAWSSSQWVFLSHMQRIWFIRSPPSFKTGLMATPFKRSVWFALSHLLDGVRVLRCFQLQPTSQCYSTGTGIHPILPKEWIILDGSSIHCQALSSSRFYLLFGRISTLYNSQVHLWLMRVCVCSETCMNVWIQVNLQGRLTGPHLSTDVS